MRRRIKPGMERIYKDGRVIRLVPQVDVARLLKQKKAVEIHKNGVYMGIRLVEYSEIAKVRRAQTVNDKADSRSVLEDADCRRSCVVLSRAEVEAIVHRTPSRTEGLKDDAPERDARVLQGLPEMDLPERARRKFKQMFPAGMASA
jgi:hypothetical protein